LVSKASTLGWPTQQVVVIDEDLGLSGAGVVERSGFARLTAEVALGHVGIVLGLEVSRLARNNADWYRLLDLCGLTDTLIGDADGVYHPALFNDRLLLGLKGTMSEAELHVLRARLNGGIRNKAARGELRRGLPVGFVWGEEDGEVRFHPDEAVCTAIRTVFARFSELGSVRRVWLWLRSEGLSFPLQTRFGGNIRWVDPSYVAIYHVLTNPVYAGAYAKNATPPDVDRIRSAEIDQNTLQRISLQPRGGICSGVLASRPRPGSRERARSTERSEFLLAPTSARQSCPWSVTFASGVRSFCTGRDLRNPSSIPL
jgi:DNA invertase Pin-like site-specific DNA recombinase